MISQQEYDNLYSAAERALHVDKVAYEVSSYLALPQLAAFSMAARDFQDTDRARLAAPTAYERLWATGQAGGVAPQLRSRPPKIFRFCRDVSSEPRPLFEALFRRVRWHGGPMEQVRWSYETEPDVGTDACDKDVGNFALRLRPRFSCGRGDPLLCGLDACRLKDVFVSFCCYATMAWVSSDYRDHLGRAGAGVDPWRDGDYVRLKWGRRNEYYPDTPDESDSDADY